MSKLLTAFFTTSFLYFPFSVHASCNDLVEDSYFRLSPRHEELLVGLLVETPQGQKYLAVSDYYTGDHGELHHALTNQYPNNRILWAGEFLLQNLMDETAVGVITDSLNTSGYTYKSINFSNNERGHVNDPEALRIALEHGEPALISSVTQYGSYSDDFPHLDSLFRDLHDRIRSMHANTNVRHEIRNLLNVAGILGAHFEVMGTSSWKKSAQFIGNLSQQSVLDILTLYKSLSQYTKEELKVDGEEKAFDNKIAFIRSLSTDRDALITFIGIVNAINRYFGTVSGRVEILPL